MKTKYPYYALHMVKYDLNGIQWAPKTGHQAMVCTESGGSYSYPYVTESQYKRIKKLLDNKPTGDK